MKRFTSKEEKRRLQCALFFEEDLQEFNNISTENHLNFITKIDGQMGKDELYGLFTILNSYCYDRYFRMLNGSTQVNSNEINSLPFPLMTDIIQIGRKAMAVNNLSELDCDEILKEHFANMPISIAK